MKNPNQNKLREILAQMLKTHEMELTPVHTPPEEYESVEQAEQAILEWVNEVIGANTPLRSTDEVAAWKHAQNQLRAIQRKRAGL